MLLEVKVQLASPHWVKLIIVISHMTYVMTVLCICSRAHARIKHSRIYDD